MTLIAQWIVFYNGSIYHIIADFTKDGLLVSLVINRVGGEQVAGYVFRFYDIDVYDAREVRTFETTHIGGFMLYTVDAANTVLDIASEILEWGIPLAELIEE